MNKVLIAGVDSIGGAHLAAAWNNDWEVLGLSFSEPLSIAGQHCPACPAGDPLAIQEWVHGEAPDWVVYCGPASEPAWTSGDWPGSAALLADVRAWVEAVRSCGCRLAYISSDAVFTGPRMFHEEDDTHWCPSGEAGLLRNLEALVREQLPEALVVRTHLLGWSPLPERPGFVEHVLRAIEGGPVLAVDCVRHATPLLATEFAELMRAALAADLSGVFHAGGAERVNPYRLAALLAAQLGRGYVAPPSVAPLESRPQGFGCGETSLHSRKIRRAVGHRFALLSEALPRLMEERGAQFGRAPTPSFAAVGAGAGA